MPTTTLRDNIRRLDERGLVVRVPNPDDGRFYLLVLTPRGEAVTRAAGEALRHAYAELERVLPLPLPGVELQLERLSEALQRLVDSGSR